MLYFPHQRERKKKKATQFDFAFDEYLNMDTKSEFDEFSFNYDGFENCFHSRKQNYLITFFSHFGEIKN